MNKKILLILMLTIQSVALASLWLIFKLSIISCLIATIIIAISTGYTYLKITGQLNGSQ